MTIKKLLELYEFHADYAEKNISITRVLAWYCKSHKIENLKENKDFDNILKEYKDNFHYNISENDLNDINSSDSDLSEKRSLSSSNYSENYFSNSSEDSNLEEKNEIISNKNKNDDDDDGNDDNKMNDKKIKRRQDKEVSIKKDDKNTSNKNKNKKNNKKLYYMDDINDYDEINYSDVEKNKFLKTFKIFYEDNYDIKMKGLNNINLSLKSITLFNTDYNV